MGVCAPTRSSDAPRRLQVNPLDRIARSVDFHPFAGGNSRAVTVGCRLIGLAAVTASSARVCVCAARVAVHAVTQR
jgi:hypothetical protein